MSEIEQTPLVPPQKPSGGYRLMDWVSSFFDISLQAANRFYTLGWSLSFTGALITFMGVILLMWGTRVRDHDFETSMATLHENAAASEKTSTELKKGNLNLQIDLERERSSRLKLEAKLAPRLLSSEQRSAFTSTLIKFKGIAADIVVYPTGTSDIGPLQHTIATALSDAGWTIRAWNILNGELVIGVGVATKAGADANIELAANSLISALNAAGILAGRAAPLVGNDFPMPAIGPAPVGEIAPIRIYIGTKPP